MGRHRDVAIGNRTGRGVHMRDDPRQAVIAGRAQVRLTADPGFASLARIVGVGVVGRADEHPGRRDALLLRAPSCRIIVAVNLLHPDAAQHAQRRKLDEPLRSPWRAGGGEEVVFVVSH